MQRFASCLFVAPLFVAIVAAAADTPVPDKPMAGRMVTIEVAIAEISDAGVKFETGDKVGDKLNDLEKQAKVTVLTRMKLATLEHSQATVQIGENVAVATGRTRGFGGGEAPNARGSTSYTWQNVGTKLNVTPQVEEDGAVLVILDVENSRLAAVPKDEAEDFPPPRSVQLGAKSSVRIPAGQTVVVAVGAQSAIKGESGQSVILISAQTSAAPKLSSHAGPQLRAFSLVNADAHAMTTFLDNLFAGSHVKVVFDARTNTVLAQGSDAELNEIEAILSKLDQVAKK